MIFLHVYPKARLKKYSAFICYALLAILLLLAGCSKSKAPPVTKEEAPTKKSLSLLMVGDALIQSSIYNGAKTEKSWDFKPMLAGLAPTIEAADLAYYNQEAMLAGDQFGISNFPLFNSPQIFGVQMLEMGFNLISLANNHTMDKDEIGVLGSVKFWRSQKGDYLVTGSADSMETVLPPIKEKNGIRYSMLAYTDLLNREYDLVLKKPYLVNMYEKKRITAEIAQLRPKVDLLIVSMHWGVEYTNTPTPRQVAIAHYLASQGVDIIVGMHPHVLQPYEFIDKTLVFYSMGNFFGAQIPPDTHIGLMSTVQISKEGDQPITISKPTNELLYCYSAPDLTGWHYHVDRVNSVLQNVKLATPKAEELRGLQKKYEALVTNPLPQYYKPPKQ